MSIFRCTRVFYQPVDQNVPLRSACEGLQQEKIPHIAVGAVTGMGVGIALTYWGTGQAAGGFLAAAAAIVGPPLCVVSLGAAIYSLSRVAYWYGH